MAKAPRPGVTKRAEQTAEVQRVIAIETKWDGLTHRIVLKNVDMANRFVVKRELKMTLDEVLSFNDLDSDTCAVLVWLSKRMNGTPSLSWRQFMRTWPEPIEDGQIDIWPENVQGQRIDENGKVLDEGDPPGVDDPES